MKIIKLIKRNGEVILKTTGDNYKLIELCTCVRHDLVSYQGDTVEILVSA